MRGWIGVDLDGTLVEYDGWRGEEHFGRPVPAMVERVRKWLAEGREVRVFTARAFGERNADGRITRLIQDHLADECGLPRLEVTCAKDYGMVELWDDRCVQVIPNTGLTLREFLEKETS